MMFAKIVFAFKWVIEKLNAVYEIKRIFSQTINYYSQAKAIEKDKRIFSD